ncbi:hypothetical protein GGQ80_000144 [Sphingomonas jinjuensis]|uniref:Uncharacterized protein n=1 Tax=Sphingomonas jinjuensis TaxID=535907 RepID=A0A840FE20_9SPHN|nr:hypothetical protein [Sphingomonas jinjuensis]
MQPVIGSPCPSNGAQLRAISSSIMAQLLAALHGGCVAGETLRQTSTFRAAAAAPISARHDRMAAAAAGVMTAVAVGTLVGEGDGATARVSFAC